MKKEIILLFTKRTGMSITEAKKKLKKEATGGVAYLEAGNLTLMYTANKNYANGAKNGKGAGYYITYRNTYLIRKEIKI